MQRMNAELSDHAPLLPRAQVLNLRESKIREVANAGMGRTDVLPFWFGEPDQVTPQFIRDAAIKSLSEGETFYSHNLGLAELRETLSTYLSTIYARNIPTPQIAVTTAGVNALSLVAQALVEPGDHVVCVTPLWPNLVEIPKILSGDVTCVPLRFGDKGWALDMPALLDALRPGTKMLFVNSPNNPTGWTLSRAEQTTILSHCRQHGIWIVSDDAYERLYYGSDSNVAPSFFSIATEHDRLISTNTFSKSWLMTGWRLGWIVAPAPFIAQLGKLIEYNTSCASVFTQRAGVQAVRAGEPTVAQMHARMLAARNHLNSGLQALDGIRAIAAPGAMYAFFKLDGLTDSLALCKHLVAQHGLGLAPGAAFGDEGEGFVRWCFASELPRLDVGLEKFAAGLHSWRSLGGLG
jgi:aspartate/methionine/tyrosine aminotransferase